MIMIFVIISVIFISILILFTGKSRGIEKKDKTNTNIEICFSVGIFISFFLPWVTFTTDNIGLGTFGLDTRSLAEVSWAKLIKLAWNIYDLANQFDSQSSNQQARLIAITLLVSFPLIMATVNIFLLIAGRVRGWSFYTGIIALCWTGTCLYGYSQAHGMISFGIGFIIGTCCAACLIISSLITMLINVRQHLSFVLGHFSLIIFIVLTCLIWFAIPQVIGLNIDNYSILKGIFLVLPLILTFVCNYYLYMYLSRRKNQDANDKENTHSVPSPVTGNEHAESVLDQHWMYCTKCGTKCKDYLKFCPRCGFGLHPEREEPSHGDSDYAPPRRAVERPEYSPEKETDYTRSKPIPFIDNQIRPVVTRAGGVIHVENTVHPTVENSPEPQMKKTPKVVERKIPTLPSAARGNKWGLWVLIAFAVLLVGSIPAYLFWYKPYATDRDAPRYFTFTNLNLRSSKIADVKHNLLELLPYGTELIVYSIDADWASVKAGNQKGYVASSLILPMADFELLNSIWGNTDAKECINTSKCRLALLDYYKRFNMSGGTEWQIYTRKKEDRVNSVYYKKLYNPNSKYADFTFIVRNNRTNERELVIYSFDDETEKPIYRTSRRLFQSDRGNISSMNRGGEYIFIRFSENGEVTIKR